MFAEARLDELEVTAKAAADRVGSPEWREAETPDGRSTLVMGDVEHGAHTALVSHFALHDPARELRRIALKRAILVEHGPSRQDATRCRVCTAIHEGHAQRFRAPCPTVRYLIAEWSEHPDYDQAWKPQEDL